MRQPITKVVSDIYLQAFSYSLLIALVCMALFFVVAIKVAFMLSQSEPFNAAEVVLWLGSIFGMKGSCFMPKQFISATLIVTLALLFSMVIFSAFAASATAKLSIQVQEIHSPADLLYDTNFRIGFTPKDEAMLKLSLDPILKEVYRRGMRNRNELVMGHDEGLQKALDNNYAIFGERRIFRRAIWSLPGDQVCSVSSYKLC